jgi:hypothetical protein
MKRGIEQTQEGSVFSLQKVGEETSIGEVKSEPIVRHVRRAGTGSVKLPTPTGS